MTFNFILCLTIVLIYFSTHISNSKPKKNQDYLFLIISFLILFILVGFREMTRGNDTLAYINLFQKCEKYKWSILSINNYYETGYIVLNILISFFTNNLRVFMVLFSAYFNYATFSFIKKNSDNYLFSTLMYICLLFLYDSMSMFRQFFALSIILLGFDYIKNKKFIKYTLTVIFATFFHSSAFIAIFLYLLYNFKYNRKRVFIIIIFSIICYSFLNVIYPFIAGFFSRETSYIDTIGNITYANILYTVVFLVLFLFAIFIVPLNKREENGFYLYSLLFATSLFFISIKMPVLSRGVQYYSIMSIIALPNLIEKNLQKNRLVYKTIIICMFLLYSSIIIKLRPEWNSAFDYKSCIFPKKDYVCYYK